MPLTKSQLVIVSVVVGVILIFVLIFLGIIPGLKKKNEPVLPSVTLNVWTLFDQRENYEGLLRNFQQLYTNVTVRFQYFDDQPEYENAVLNALAAGTGPDVFMIQNDALLKDVDKLSPAPATKYSLALLRTQFPQVVAEDFVYQNQIYALPLSLDTLALIYNRDIFNQKGVVLPPATWEEFTALVPKFAEKDQLGRITTAGAAIGGSQKTINRAADILTLLLLQKEAANFSSSRAAEALDFYVRFANAVSPVYTWNDTLPNDLEMFSGGKAAMIFNYAPVLAELRRNPSLNFSVAPVPQFEGTPKGIAYPRYWGFGVTKQSRNKNAAWDFIIYLTTNFDAAKDYSDRTGKPPALNTLINQKINDLDLAVFARQALIAKSWQKVNPLIVDSAISDAIENVINGRLNSARALGEVQNQFNQLVPKL